MEAMRVLRVDGERMADTALANGQSAQKGINPPPTGDVASPVCDQNLQMVVEQVRDQLRQLMLQRQKIDYRVAIIKRTIKGLALLYGDESLRRPEEVAASKRTGGIANACRIVLDRADTPLTAGGVYVLLQEQFPDVFRRPGDHHASVVSILNRLTKYGEADTFVSNGSRFWQRRLQSDSRSVGLSGT